MSNKLRATAELQDIFSEYVAALDCRDKAIESFFHSKRAIAYGRHAEKTRLKFWDMAYKLYPKIKVGVWEYDYSENVFSKKEATNEKR